MTPLRTLLLLGLLVATCAAPVEHQVAGQSQTDAEVGQTATTPSESAAVTAAAVGTESQPDDVYVSVATSTSVEISTIVASVSSEMEPLPESAGRPQGSEEAPGAEEEECAPGTEEEKAAEEDEEADLQVSTTMNKVNIEPAAVSAMETVKSGVEQTEKPASLPPAIEVATSVSMETTKTMMSVSSKDEEAAAAQSAASEAESSGDRAEKFTVASDAAGDGELVEERVDGSGGPADSSRADQDASVDSSGPRAEYEGSGAGGEASSTDGRDTGSDESSGNSESADDNTTKGTLIFDLGPSASDELHDLVQQTVLDALMDEDLLSAVAADDLRPVIEAEGSGIVFLDGSGSGDPPAEDVNTSPFVSIHF